MKTFYVILTIGALIGYNVFLAQRDRELFESYGLSVTQNETTKVQP